MGRKKRGTPMRRVQLFLSERQVERVEAHCLRTGLDRSAVIRAALDEHLGREDRRRAKGEQG